MFQLKKIRYLQLIIIFGISADPMSELLMFTSEHRSENRISFLIEIANLTPIDRDIVQFHKYGDSV